MVSQGAADAGELERILVMDDDQLLKNLVLISKFDVTGHTIIFDEGVCTIKHKSTGIVKGIGYLDKSTMLYMLDIRTLTEHRDDLLLAHRPPSNASPNLNARRRPCYWYHNNPANYRQGPTHL